MYWLYGLIILMLGGSIVLFSIPFVRTRTLTSGYFIFSAGFVILFALGLYIFTTPRAALNNWLTQGRNHYELQVTVQSLGGLPGMIDRVKRKLADNPNDIEGWMILGKLYLVNQQDEKAKEAFREAARLRLKSQ